MSEYATAAREALASQDAWAAFRGYVERACAMQAADRGVRDVLTMTFPTAKGLREQRDAAFRHFRELIRRTQAEGHLRQDLVPEDLVLILMANAGVIRGTRDTAPPAWKRFVGLMLDACRAESAHEFAALALAFPATGRCAAWAALRVGKRPRMALALRAAAPLVGILLITSTDPGGVAYWIGVGIALPSGLLVLGERGAEPGRSVLARLFSNRGRIHMSNVKSPRSA